MKLLLTIMMTIMTATVFGADAVVCEKDKVGGCESVTECQKFVKDGATINHTASTKTCMVIPAKPTACDQISDKAKKDAATPDATIVVPKVEGV
jgi:hypothetical protein